MKRFVLYFLSLILTISFAFTATPVAAATPNLFSNPSLETASGTTPASWSTNKYDTNSATFAYSNGGHTGTKSAAITMKSYKSGDAKWVPADVAVTPSTKYNFSEWYKSTTTTYVKAVYTSTTGVITYIYVAAPAKSTNWKSLSYAITTPADVKSMTIYHLIQSNGTLSVDDYSLNAVDTPVPPAPAPGNLIPNSSAEDSTNNIPTNWGSDSRAVNTGSNTFESTGHTGNHSLKTTISTFVKGDAYWYFTPVAITSGKTYSYSNYYMSSADTEIDVMVNLANGSSAYYYLGMAAASPSSWSKIAGEFTMPTGAVSATIYQALATVGYVQTDDYSLADYQPAKLNRGLLSIDFDDGWRSIYQNALPVMANYGIVSTQYIITGKLTDTQYMDVAMIQAIKNQGHEIGSHTVSHPHLTTLSGASLTSELANSQATLRQSFGTVGVADNFASPYGEFNSGVIAKAQKYYRSHRSTDIGFNAKGDFDIYNIKVQNIIDTTTASDIQNWISEALSTNTWLVLVYHEIGTTYDSTKFSTTPAAFDAQMKVVQQSGITVKTTNQALDEIIPQL